MHMGYGPRVRSRWLDTGQVLLFGVFMDRSGVVVDKLAENERGQYLAILTEQVWPIKDFLHGFRENVSCRTQRVVPSRQDSAILLSRISNHIARFDSSCWLTERAM